MNEHLNGQQATTHTTDWTWNMNFDQKGDEPMNTATNGHTGAMFLQDVDAIERMLHEELGASVWDELAEPQRGQAGGRHDANAKKLTAQLNFVLCVGGTGVKVGTHLKARFIESLGYVPRNVMIAAMDGADDPIAVREGRNNSIVSLNWGDERHQFDPVPVANIVRRLEQHPEIDARFGRETLLKTRDYIFDGAAGERPQGAILILWNAQRLMQLINNGLRRLAERTKDLQQVMDGNVVLRVYIVGSIAGGMGAGALIDLAYIMRDELQKLGTLGESSSIHAMLMLPGAFYGIEDTRKQANSYATLHEINALMLGEADFSASYPNGRRIDTMLPPFRDVAVYDGVNEHGRTWRSTDEIVALMAETLWLLTSSEVGSQEINLKINDAGVLKDVGPGGYATCAATSGAVVLRFPARTATVWCALRHAARMIGELMAAPGVGETAGQPTAVLRDLAGLRDRFLNNDDGVPHQVRLIAPTALMELPIEEVPGQTRNLFENFMQRRLYDDIFAQMKQRTEEQKVGLIELFDSQMAAMLETGRPLLAAQWLETNRHALTGLLAAVVSEQNQLSQVAQQHQGALESASVALERACSGINAYLPIVGRNQVRSAVNVYLDEATALARVRLAQRVEEMCAEVLYRLNDWVQQNQRKLEVVIARLQQAREWLTAYEVMLSRRGSGRSEISLLDNGLVDVFYRTHAGNAQAAAQTALAQSGGLLAWAGQKPEQIGRLLVQVGMSSFHKVAQLSVEEVMRLRFPDRSPAQWLTMMQALAAGSWNLDRAMLRGGGANLVRILTIGVPDEAKSIFQDGAHDGLVSTHDPERIVVLLTVYGASFDALKGFPQWEAAYQAQRTQRQVHVLPYFMRNGDQAARIFGIGLAFDLIQTNGAWYYYRPEDVLADKVRLGQGLESALTGLATNQSVQTQIVRRVEAQIAAQGNAAAAERIQRWIERNGVNGDETLKRMRLAVRAYAENELGMEMPLRTERQR